ncbi:MAG: LptF/LptG family permease [Elusimicrobiales bacterium]|nr:LptF/LptG family permease [Elusimicrobiales bacterium]
MKTIDKYIIKKNIYYLTATTIVTFIFIVTVNFFEGLNMITRKNMELSQILKQSLYTSPFYLYLLTPLVVLISSLLLLNYFKITSQYKAIYSSTYPPTTFIRNMILVSIILSIILFIVVDKFTTSLYASVKKKIKFSENLNFSINEIIFYGKLKNQDTIEDIYIYNMKSYEKIYAKKMIWNNKDKKWDINEAYQIRTQESKIETKKYDILEIKTIPPPEQFIIEEITDPNSYSIYQLIERIKKLKKLSLNINQEQVIIFFRVGIIFTNIIVIFLSYIIFKTPLIEYKGYSITLAIIFSLFIWFLITIFKRTADIEIIPAWSISIIPHLIISFMLITISRKIDKIF